MSVPAMNSARYYITFGLGDEIFAIDVRQVREVLDITPITRIPTAPPYVRGIVNVRGTAIPVIDLRLKFGLSPTEDTLSTRILIFELELDGEPIVLGGLADGVYDVVELDAAEIHVAPRVAMRWRAELVAGVCRRGERFLIILDMPQVFSLRGLMVTQADEGMETVDERSGAA